MGDAPMRDSMGPLTSISNANNLNVRAPTLISHSKVRDTLIGTSPYIYIYFFFVCVYVECNY